MNAFRFLPESASTFSGTLDLIFFAWVAVSSVVLFIIFYLLIFYSAKYRKSGRADRQINRKTGPIKTLKLEIAWSVIPLLIFVGFFIWNAHVFVAMNTPPAGAMTLYVAGKQWMWKFQHPSGRREINEFHVPIHRPIKLVMTSEDVIHSFFVPAFRIKRDLLPGRYVTTWFEATKTGSYDLACAEYCGTDHARMRGRVIVMDPPSYEAWLSEKPAEEPEAELSFAAQGRALFRSAGCVTCHGSGFAASSLAPPLLGLSGKTVFLEDGRQVTADENYIRESILLPAAKIVAGFQPVMPSYQNVFSEDQIIALVEYIKSLGGSEQPQTPSTKETQ